MFSFPQKVNDSSVIKKINYEFVSLSIFKDHNMLTFKEEFRNHLYKASSSKITPGDSYNLFLISYSLSSDGARNSAQRGSNYKL